MSISIPRPGTKVLVFPAGSGTPWEARIVDYTSEGLLRVISTRPGATTVQKLGADTRVDLLPLEVAIPQHRAIFPNRNCADCGAPLDDGNCCPNA